jgi:hypothetical protein
MYDVLFSSHVTLFLGPDSFFILLHRADAMDQLVTFGRHIKSIDGSTGYIECRIVLLRGRRRVWSEWDLLRSAFNAVGSAQCNDTKTYFAIIIYCTSTKCRKLRNNSTERCIVNVNY